MQEKKLTGYPSIDRPWLKYYSEEAINAPLPECTIYEYLRAKNEDNMEHTALQYYGSSISFQRLFATVDCVADALLRMGLAAGDTVTIAMINQPEAIYLMLALNKIGAAANFVFGGATTDELKYQMINSQSNIVFTADLFANDFCAIAKEANIHKIILVPLTQSMSAPYRLAIKLTKKQPAPKASKIENVLNWKQFLNSGQGASTNIAVAHDADAVAFITYTGGTTGGSKGVMLTNKAALAVAEQYMRGELELRRESTWLQIIPFFTAYGVTCSLIIPMAVGMTLIIRMPLMETLQQLFKKFKPNHIVGGPAVWESFADENAPLDLSGLIAPISGGDTLRATAEAKVNAYLERRGCRYSLMNGYGMTEVGAAVSCNFKDKYEFGSVGAPFVKNIIAAFDVETGEELPYDEEGEICICTPSMMLGYAANPTETENILRTHADGKTWVHSGDLGYISPNGFVHISGRLKRYTMTYTNGIAKKIFSLDVERALLQHKCVSNCAVVPMPDKEKNQVPAAFIISKDAGFDQTRRCEELGACCEKALHKLYCPAKYFFVDSFPRTKLGKVDYLALERMAAEAQKCREA